MPTLKDRKRILNKDGTPAKVVKKLDQSPVFRQNGYNLKFDDVNSDYLSFAESQIISNVSDIDIEVDFILNENAASGLNYLFEKGVFSSPTNGYIRCYRDTSENLIVQLRDKGAFYAQFLTPISQDVNYNLIIKNREVILNGTILGVFSEATLNINGSIQFFARISGSGDPTEFINGSILSLNYQNETFNFSESYGTTITGDNGTVATINTSAAQAENYTNTEIWQKNEFALEFDSVNQEYLYINKSEVVQNLSDFSLELPIEVKNYVIGQRILIIGSFNNPSTGLFQIVINSDSVLQITSSGKSNLNVENKFITGVNFNQKNTIIVIGQDIYLNGTLKTSFSTDILLDLDLSINRFNSSVDEIVLYPFSIQDETFPLIVGLGNTITGSNGTAGTINTSAAQVKDRVNFGMWQKNGYVLKFDAVNEDYLSFPDYNFINGGSLFTELNNYDISSGVIYIWGNTQQTREYLLISPTTINLRDVGTDTTLVLNHSESIINTCYITRDSDVIEVFLNGSSIGTLDVTGKIYSFNQINNREAGSYFQNFTLKRFDLENETFHLTEGSGATTTGSNGTVVTINTSAAQASDYIDNEVWNESSNKWEAYTKD